MSEPASAVPAVDRPRLIRLAYRLLGSVEDAEDVVQDAHLRLLAGGHTPDDPGAYLFRTVTHLAIDRLRRLKVQRRAYAGPWLPEPLDTADEDASAPAERRQDLGIGLLLLLERLSVGERVAYVLREAFDLDFRTMSEVLD
ncbi:MAG: RNA polymerase subunit sigma-24, partial [Gammaproteobacteria bacterium]|nr:RNA polymerase subunit sigma-24 [Gammaproteobacteria bacterium]